MGGDAVGDYELEHQHGKARVRVARVWREGNSHVVVEWSVAISVYVLAKHCGRSLSLEEFGVMLGEHFVTTYPEEMQGTWKLEFLNEQIYSSGK
ncbi:hypothetical protein R1flu_027354 [Riccia fluitans]|uniref:factor independent urate hydroxylase n=1 Tax=Riccia fluitans TaxID=41844 RepID=A0ABD1XIM7_9MARC